MKFILQEFCGKYYDTLNNMVNDLAKECTGGEECSLSFPCGRVTIQLK